MDTNTQIQMNTLDRKYHFIGIGGIGMSGLARILSAKKIAVSGSDASASSITNQLKEIGIDVSIGHAHENLKNASHVVISSQINANNPELIKAKELDLPILHRSDLLHLLMESSKPLLVAGSHGKTTTSALLSYVLEQAGFDPSFAVGGIFMASSLNAHLGQGKYFVVEADESDGTFLKYEPFGAIITNIDNDHLDHFGTEAAMVNAFDLFQQKVTQRNLLFIYGDDPHLTKITDHANFYGFGSHCNLKADNYQFSEGRSWINIRFKNLYYTKVEIALTGKHNALNALAVFGFAIELGVPEKIIRDAFKSFKGVRRRAEIVAEVNAVTIIDDYAHHPTEIEATLKALKQAYPNRRLIALFQPHRFTRTRDCLKQYGHSFHHADLVMVTDIYSAFEEKIDNIHAEDIVKEIQQNSSVQSFYIAQNHLMNELHGILKPFDVVVTLGAGDITKEGPKLAAGLKLKPLKRLKCALVFGGKSVEHEISLKSAKNIADGIDKNLYDLEYNYIQKDGSWIYGEDARKILYNPFFSLHKASTDIPLAIKQLMFCDFVYPCLHGTNGEDGKFQGMMELLNLTYVGCNPKASAITMDKTVTKKMVESRGLQVANYLEISSYNWVYDQELSLQNILENFSFPLFVKPIQLGSTIGISKVDNKKSLIEAINFALKYDEAVLIETAIIGREIEFVVIGKDMIRIYPPGEVLTEGKVFDYESKYSPAGFETVSRANLTSDEISAGMNFAKSAYIATGCDGYARVDCFLQDDGQWILNEINTIPGFTSTSIFPKICSDNGLPLPDLINQLILWGFERSRKQQRLCNKSPSEIFV